MESQEFVVLYTHQKTKKSKVWQDGILKITHLGNKAILYDDKGECLDSLFLKRLEVKPGDGLESDRYSITVEEVRAAGGTAVNQDRAPEAPKLSPQQVAPSGRSVRCQPAGLKRKFTGFQGPRQVPKKMVVMDNGESAASLEAVTPGPAVFSLFSSPPPLFSAAGKRGVRSVPADPGSSVVCEDRWSSGPPFPSTGSAPSSRSYQEILWQEGHLCSPVRSEPTEGHSVAPACSGAAQSIRSRARILALLKSNPTSASKEVDSEMSGHFPQVQPQGSLKIPTKQKCFISQEECAEGRRESSQYQQPSERPMRNESRWAVYLSSPSSPVHSAVARNDLEGKPQAQGDDIHSNLRDFLVQKRIQLFEAGAENGEKCNEEKVVDNIDPSQDQEVKQEIPLCSESNSLPITCGNVGNDGLVSESDIQENIQIPVNQNDHMCIKGLLLTRENAQAINTCGTPEKDHEQAVSSVPKSKHLQIESSLNNSSGISEAITDMFPRSNTDNESLSIHRPMSSVTQPVLQVNFNLNNFETSDTEEESQESNKMSQDPEDWEREALADDCSSGVPRTFGNAPLSLSVSQLCGAAGPTGGETAGCSDSAVEWADDVCAGSEDAHAPIQKLRSNYDFASLPNTSKGINSNLHIPHFLNIDTTQTPESNLFSEQTQHQSFCMGSDLDENDEPVLLPTSGRDSSIQLSNASETRSEKGTVLDESDPRLPSSSFYPLGRDHPISKDMETHLSESEDLGGIPGSPRDHTEGHTAAAASTQSWNSPRMSSEPSGLKNSICLLKSLSEHSTALEGLEIVKKKNTTFKQQGTPQTQEPEYSPEAGKPLVTGVSQAVPKSPHLNQDSQLCFTLTMMKENEVEQSEPLQSSQFFSLGNEEETVFPAVTPKQIERKIWDPQPVEFQGHQVHGSAASAVMVRGHSSWLDCGQFPGSEHDSYMSRAVELPRTCMQVDFLQVTAPEQGGSACSPVSPFSLDSPDGDFVLEFSEESLKAKTSPVMKKFRSPEKQSLQRLPLLSRARVPLLTVPPSEGPPAVDPRSCDRQLPSGSPPIYLREESAALPLSSGPEDRSAASLCRASREVTPGHVSRLDRASAQSKWLKYQNPPQCDLTTPSRPDTSATDGFFAKAIPGTCCSDAGEREHSSDSVSLQVVRGVLRRQQQQGVGSQDFVCRKEARSLRLKPASKDAQKVLGESACSTCHLTGVQEINVSELCFPSGQKIKSALLPQRQTRIPVVFQSPAHYKQVFTSCLIEHLNILLFELAQRLHKALSTVDISFYTSSKGEKLETGENRVPSCHHHRPAKLVMVKKEGPNKGRLFYTCDAPKGDQCKFFKWLEEVTPGHVTQEQSPPAVVLGDIKSLGVYLRSQKLPLYEECQLLVRKGFDFQRKQHGKLKKFMTVNAEFYNEPKSKLYLKLSRKEGSSTYSKDDLWVVSKTLDFELDTFIACSAFFGPTSVNEVELLPLKGYFPSNWPADTVVHALLVCNASSELTTLRNLQDYFRPAALPLTPHLLAMSSSTTVSSKRGDKRTFIPPAFSSPHTKCDLPSLGAALQLASDVIQAHKLNEDQATALTQIARMVASQGHAEDEKGLCASTPPITIIHGVFGAGKSYLLAVVILFLVQLFEKSEAPTAGSARPWKVLVSSSTNVAVDRVLLGLLSLGFEKFVRVGSVRKIAKPVLPYSLHVGSESANEQIKELQALMKEDLTPQERVCVRRSIEQHKLGTNRTLLRQVPVVGVTCAACLFPCMNELKFPVVVLDECSQITEPASLLPIARFECEKLVLVGDPKQLPPTIQGSDAAHGNGLEQTLFDRLCLMGHKPVLLRTQYRCHPAITAIADDLFYGGNLRNGVSEAERSPLLEWLPTLCFYDVQGHEQMDGGNSFHNEAEAAFTLMLIQSLVAGGVEASAIGVVTLYKSQLRKLCHLLSTADAEGPSLRAVQMSTVDAFQGAEKDVVVLSCVRTRQVGFVDSEKRANVALTRGRRHLLILGNLACLRRSRLWGRVIRHCEGREAGLQRASQCEPRLSRLLRRYSEERAAAKRQKRSGQDRGEDVGLSADTPDRLT
uniref:5'-3' DNA helicase ZGRF1 n=2 Tax=Molossus molossus TaxID=27622 RepID=A0A7J8IEE1_MOLMO|nr:zinc finger GRF-type containing 1 [Molossus molossus]